MTPAAIGWILTDHPQGRGGGTLAQHPIYRTAPSAALGHRVSSLAVSAGVGLHSLPAMPPDASHCAGEMEDRAVGSYLRCVTPIPSPWFSSTGTPPQSAGTGHSEPRAHGTRAEDAVSAGQFSPGFLVQFLTPLTVFERTTSTALPTPCHRAKPLSWAL